MYSAPAIPESESMQLGSDVWAERFAPRASSDLAVHKDKVKELKEWIELNRSHLQRGSTAGQRLLLLRGPSGSGKTAMVKVAAAGWQVCVLEPYLCVRVCFYGYASMQTRARAHTHSHVPSTSRLPPRLHLHPSTRTYSGTHTGD
jgi:hypothetical protein